VKIDAVKAQTRLFGQRYKQNAVRISHIYWPLLLEFGTRHLHIMLLGICEFRENWYRGGRTFLVEEGAIRPSMTTNLFVQHYVIHT
jgi:hypothetical protein